MRVQSSPKQRGMNLTRYPVLYNRSESIQPYATTEVSRRIKLGNPRGRRTNNLNCEHTAAWLMNEWRRWRYCTTRQSCRCTHRSVQSVRNSRRKHLIALSVCNWFLILLLVRHRACRVPGQMLGRCPGTNEERNDKVFDVQFVRRTVRRRRQPLYLIRSSMHRQLLPWVETRRTGTACSGFQREGRKKWAWPSWTWALDSLLLNVEVVSRRTAR